jgi:hypothetical protein
VKLIYGTPTCTYASFASHLLSHGSPAAPEAKDCWATFVSLGIDPAVALGFFHHESSCGQMGRAKITKSWGNIRWLDVYGSLPYPVANVDGFVGYTSFTEAARHFGEHLKGLDGTHSYFGKLTVEAVVPIWAPAPTNNPPRYIEAVIEVADQLARGGFVMAKPKVLHIAGHLRTKDMTEEGLCDGLDKAASVIALKGMTGTGGEQDFTAHMAALQAELMNTTGLIEAKTVDACYSKALYIDWKPNLVIAHHIHRDGDHRAMFAIPDNKFKFHSDVANKESYRFMARVMGRYTDVTGIPLDQASITLRMTQLYNWCYLDEDSEAQISEYGNGNFDTVALFNADSVLKIAQYFTACVLEHFNLTAVVPGGPKPPTPSLKPTKAELAALLRDIADEVEAL